MTTQVEQKEKMRHVLRIDESGVGIPVTGQNPFRSTRRIIQNSVVLESRGLALNLSEAFLNTSNGIPSKSL